MVNIKLKPCPFCGNKGELITPRWGISFVKCQLCWARTDLAKASKKHSSDEIAAALWNRRADNG